MIRQRIEGRALRERERERVRRRPRFHGYDDIISTDNLLEAWREFLRGKRKREDVTEFSLHMADNIILLHRELKNQTYRHGLYKAFRINDPKPRQIHKAGVRDRLVHHAVYRILYPYFDHKFIFDSYSCRKGKGTHRAMNRFRQFGRKVSRNYTKTVWVLKGDIKKFFASINQKILLGILAKYTDDEKVLWLLGQIIESYSEEGKSGVGLPLGNLTSQILVNIYMNEFDQFVKRKLKIKYYIRYADDFVIMSSDKMRLAKMLPMLEKFLSDRLKLILHPDKLFIKTLASGIDFLGWVHFTYFRVLRTTTRRRMKRNLKDMGAKKESVASYMGLLSHGDTWKLRKELGRITSERGCGARLFSPKGDPLGRVNNYPVTSKQVRTSCIARSLVRQAGAEVPVFLCLYMFLISMRYN